MTDVTVTDLSSLIGCSVSYSFDAVGWAHQVVHISEFSYGLNHFDRWISGMSEVDGKKSQGSWSSAG